MAMESPNVVVTVEDGTETEGIKEKRTVRFQCGLLRETETFVGQDVEFLCRETLLDYICDMLTVKFPEHPYGDLLEKVLLYKHTSDNSLAKLTDSDPIEDGTIIDIVLAADAKQEYDDTICPHILRVQTYKGPTFCDYCGVILLGLLKQGLSCEGCDKNFHKRCAYKIPNNCTRLKTADGISSVMGSRPSEAWSGRPLWIDRTLKSRPQVPHTFFVHSFKKPTVCHYCKKLLKGVFRQGLRCKDCKMNCHKRCARELGNNCPGEVPSLSRVDSGEWSMSRSMARNVIANEYSLAEDSYTEMKEAAPAPQPEETTPCREDSPASSSSSLEHIETSPQVLDHSYMTVDAPMDTIAEEDTTSNEGSEHNLAEQHDSADNIKLQRVTGVSLRHTKQPPASVMKEGWMVHYTNKSTVRKKFYWRLDTKCLTFYKSDTSPHYHKEIQLADVLAVDPMASPEVYPLSPPHVFEIVTSSMTYYVGVDMAGHLPKDLKPSDSVSPNAVNILGDVSHLSYSQLEELGVGLNVGIAWEEALHSALMPITPQASMGSLADIGVPASVMRPASFRGKRGSIRGSLKGSFHGNRGNSFRGSSMRGRKGSMRGSFRVPKPGPLGGVQTRTGTNIAMLKPKVETKLDISLFYQIFPEELLGSGQFGTVYGGQNRQTGKPVAVKVIDKLRFPNKHESQLRTEVTILQTLSHPGIIFLEQMFENPEKIYVVMEKMNGDMLEMILNSPSSRLSERVTKFMVHQILTALQYLHKRDIVHCDLKPENVLLTSESNMPMAKLCDFGFARIIGEKSFRKSIVGTPAYLAPEVLKNEGYNRSLDLWSVGVIIYVSLSGTFPFNEDEEIIDQIQNAAFMFPPDPWDSVSKEAIDLIGKILQVTRKNRFKATQALNHIWLRDLQLWEDLCNLEGQLGMRYLTHESEDPFWTRQGAKPHPLAKREEQPKAHTLPSQLASHSYSSSSQDRSDGSSTLGSINGYKSTHTQYVSNGSPRSGVGTEALTTSRDGSRTPSPSTNRHSTASIHSHDSRNLDDDTVLELMSHAERVGYKVSVV